MAPEFTRIGELSGSIHRAIWSYIEDYYGETILRVDQRLRAIAVPEHLSKQLMVEPGSPALEVRRTYWSARTRPVVSSISIHPGDRYSYAMSMKRETKT